MYKLGTPRVPPQVLASRPKPCGGSNLLDEILVMSRIIKVGVIMIALTETLMILDITKNKSNVLLYNVP